MRPVRIIATVVFAAAVTVTGCTAHPTAIHPAAVPTPPVTAAPPTSPMLKHPTTTPKPPSHPPIRPIDRPSPVLADGRYDSYVRSVDSRRNRLVVDLVQVFHDQAAVTAAIADGKPRATAQYLSVYVRNHNPRLRTLPLARNLDVDLRVPCGDPAPSRAVLLAQLAKDVRAGWYYYTLTVTGGTVQRIEEQQIQPAC